MRSLRCALIGLVCLTMVGCRVDPRIALLERENRMLEDEIYRLQWALEDMQCGTSGPALRAPRSSDRLPSEPGPPRPVADEPTPAPELTDPIEQSTPKFNGQKISPEEFLNRHKNIQIPGVPDVPEHLQGPADEAPPVENPSTQQEDPGPALSLLPTGMAMPLGSLDSRDATDLVLDDRRTGGFDANGRPGDEGVSVMLQPRDATGRTIDAPGKISIAVLDPVLPGEAARVARWDFSRDDVAQLMTGVNRGRGIELNMIWPDGLPQHEELHLFARYETADGRKLQADRAIRVDLSDDDGAEARPTGWIVSAEPETEPEPAEPALSESTDLPEPGLLPEGLARPLPDADNPLRMAADSRMPAQDPASPNPPETPGDEPAGELERPSWSPERQ